jgi:ketosteroid isomerase-like protein
MASSDVEIVRELYDAFNAGDIARVRELMHDDIEWVEAPG